MSELPEIIEAISIARLKVLKVNLSGSKFLLYSLPLEPRCIVNTVLIHITRTTVYKDRLTELSKVSRLKSLKDTLSGHKGDSAFDVVKKVVQGRSDLSGTSNTIKDLRGKILTCLLILPDDFGSTSSIAYIVPTLT